MRKRGRPSNATRRPIPSEKAIIEALKGRTINEAAALLGYSKGGLRYIATGYGLDIRRNLTDEDSALIAKLIDDGMPRAIVAEKFERTEETISHHYHKATGRYIPGCHNGFSKRGDAPRVNLRQHDSESACL